VVRDLYGHGIGKKVHEEPYVPNYGKRATGVMLKEGMVICIEPMVDGGNLRNEKIKRRLWICNPGRISFGPL